MLPKTYTPQDYEHKIYSLWEASGAFTPQISKKKKPFSILMPPPNANGELHLGHATFVAISDALIRYHRLRGQVVLWLPGVDHAGILTQVTFEKKLQRSEGKTRYDLGRAELYRRCFEFCLENKSSMENQLRALGASCDWTREKFTLDPEISKLVLSTFVRLYQEGLVYRGFRIVNWCVRCRSTLSDLELEWEERTDPLYYIQYGPLVLSTVRPETKFGDTALAVHPDDKRYAQYVGQEIEIEGLLGKFKLKVIADEAVDPKFATGVIKVTPGHDPLDWEIGKRHHLEVRTVIDFDGHLNPQTGPYQGLGVLEARLKVVSDLQRRGLLEKVELNYRHSVALCERCGTRIEPLVSRQWFVRMAPLAKPAIEAVKKGRVRITPQKFEKMYLSWMGKVRDWPISRQIWWGHPLPVWYCEGCQKTSKQKEEFALLKRADPRAKTDVLDDPIVSLDKPRQCPSCAGTDLIQDPDTFDTWFSSGQWPLTTLKTSRTADFEYFYPTSVLNTAYEILFLWVARMIIFGLYLTGKVPFRVALINGILRDEKGQKMSKSKGNGIDPREMIDKYGADATRFSLLAGRESGNDLAISKSQMEDRIRGYRNFINKIWNASRFILLVSPGLTQARLDASHPYLKELSRLKKRVIAQFESYQLGQAAETLYQFFWHVFCDQYLEELKRDIKKGGVSARAARSLLLRLLSEQLKLLHPFVPFVTEAVWQEFREAGLPLSKERLLLQAPYR